MNVYIDDLQTVSDVSATLFSTVQQGAVNALVILQNVGANTLNYNFQEFNGTSWADLGAIGSVYQNSLAAGQSVSLIVTSSYAQVQLLGYASGGSTLAFSVSRLFNRTAGGPIPLVSY